MSLTREQVLEAADRLVAAFSATETEAYFASFAADASFVFHTEPARLDNRAAYERLWADWLAEGWRIVSCASTNRHVQLLGDTAVFCHDVHTVALVDGAEQSYDERETIVFTIAGDSVVAVHEHLSPAPAAS